MVEEVILLLVTQWVQVISILLMSMEDTGSGMSTSRNLDAVAMLQCILFQCQEKTGMEIQTQLRVMIIIVMQIKEEVNGVQNLTWWKQTLMPGIQLLINVILQMIKVIIATVIEVVVSSK